MSFVLGNSMKLKIDRRLELCEEVQRGYSSRANICLNWKIRRILIQSRADEELLYQTNNHNPINL